LCEFETDFGVLFVTGVAFPKLFTTGRVTDPACAFSGFRFISKLSEVFSIFHRPELIRHQPLAPRAPPAPPAPAQTMAQEPKSKKAGPFGSAF